MYLVSYNDEFYHGTCHCTVNEGILLASLRRLVYIREYYEMSFQTTVPEPC